MSRAIAVLRPEPGNRVTAAAIEARGRTAIRLPLFEVRAVTWDVPDPAAFDALILTSANAIRHGGAGLDALHALPVYAVGKVTAEAARRAGFAVAGIGEAGASELIAIAKAGGVRNALHLAARDRTLEAGGIVAQIAEVYASTPRVIATAAAAQLSGSVALVQSVRAGRRLREVIDAAQIDPSRVALAAVSAEAARGAGTGWNALSVSPSPLAEALIDTAIALAD